MRKTTALLAAALFAATGCNGKEKAQAAKVEEAQVEARAATMSVGMAADIEAKKTADEAAHRDAQLKADRTTFAAAPKDFFEASGLKVVDKGTDSQLRSIGQVTLTNKSKFPVTEVGLRVDFIKDGAAIASLPLKLKGSLPAGATKTYAVDDQTLEGAAVQTSTSDTQLVITSASLDDAPVAAVP